MVEKENWNSFLLQNKASFLQSFEWGEFQEKLGRKIWRLAIEEGDNVVLQALIVKKDLPLGKNYLYVPFGPCFKENITEEEKKKGTEYLANELKTIAKAENCLYSYLEPFLQPLPVLKKKAKSQKRIQPQQTLIIDLLRNEEEIFKSLKSKTTRYNIRFSQRQEIEFVVPEKIGEREIEVFYDLAEKSAKRDGFANYDKAYFENFFSVSSQKMPIKLFLAQYKGKYIAANIFVFFAKTAVHLFGGFDHDFRNLMAPYFMHWNQMLFAKNKMECEVYDFWGIDEKKWPGVTHFKRSFGGDEIGYPQGYDLVFNKPWYRIFKMARKIFKK